VRLEKLPRGGPFPLKGEVGGLRKKGNNSGQAVRKREERSKTKGLSCSSENENIHGKKAGKVISMQGRTTVYSQTSKYR